VFIFCVPTEGKEQERKSERARAEDNMVGGRWSHNRLLSNQHPKQADWTLSFKLTRTQLQLKRRNWLRGSTGEHEGAGESSEGAH